MALLLVGLSRTWSPSFASDAFLTNMRKAESFKEDPDKVEFYRRAINAWTPNDGNALLAECHFRLGEAHFRLLEYRTAEPNLSQAIDLDPRNGQAFLLRGRVRLKTGRANDAVADFTEFTSLAPDDLEGLLFLGDAYLADGRLPQALHSFDRAAALDASDYRPALGRGKVWQARREWDKACSAMTQAKLLARGRPAQILASVDRKRKDSCRKARPPVKK